MLAQNGGVGVLGVRPSLLLFPLTLIGYWFIEYTCFAAVKYPNTG
jgi:hypothetical protein